MYSRTHYAPLWLSLVVFGASACNSDSTSAPASTSRSVALSLAGRNARKLTYPDYGQPESREYANGQMVDGTCRFALPLREGYVSKQMEIDPVACESIVGFSRTWFAERPRRGRRVNIPSAVPQNVAAMITCSIYDFLDQYSVRYSQAYMGIDQVAANGVVTDAVTLDLRNLTYVISPQLHTTDMHCAWGRDSTVVVSGVSTMHQAFVHDTTWSLDPSRPSGHAWNPSFVANPGSVRQVMWSAWRKNCLAPTEDVVIVLGSGPNDSNNFMLRTFNYNTASYPASSWENFSPTGTAGPITGCSTESFLISGGSGGGQWIQ